MENILEFLYDLPRNTVHAPDSDFAKAARVRNEKRELLTASMTDEQKELLEEYFEADSEINHIMYFNRFRFAFRCGAQFMEELIEGRGDA